jgi:hypothetical protein
MVALRENDKSILEAQEDDPAWVTGLREMIRQYGFPERSQAIKDRAMNAFVSTFGYGESRDYVYVRSSDEEFKKAGELVVVKLDDYNGEIAARETVLDELVREAQENGEYE